MKNKMKKGVMIVLGFVLLIVLVLGYFGYFPIVSSIFGTDKAKDLGMKITEKDKQSMLAKTGITIHEIPEKNLNPKESIKFVGQKEVNDLEVTPEELSYYMVNKDWKSSPLEEDLQIRITDDVVEFSGEIDKKILNDYAQAVNLNDAELEILKQATKFMGNNKAFYLKGKLDAKNNKINYDLDEMRIGNIKVSESVLKNEDFNNVISDRIAAMPGLYVESLEIKDGKILFSGKLPSEVYIAK